MGFNTLYLLLLILLFLEQLTIVIFFLLHELLLQMLCVFEHVFIMFDFQLFVSILSVLKFLTVLLIIEYVVFYFLL